MEQLDQLVEQVLQENEEHKDFQVKEEIMVCQVHLEEQVQQELPVCQVLLDGLVTLVSKEKEASRDLLDQLVAQEQQEVLVPLAGKDHKVSLVNVEILVYLDLEEIKVLQDNRVYGVSLDFKV